MSSDVPFLEMEVKFFLQLENVNLDSNSKKVHHPRKLTNYISSQAKVYSDVVNNQKTVVLSVSGNVFSYRTKQDRKTDVELEIVKDPKYQHFNDDGCVSLEVSDIQ